MPKKTISELDDILLTQESGALVAVEQNGATFKARVRPNPPRQINVSSEAQLVAKFGSNIEIPDGEAWSISIDDSFTLSKPFKIGANSTLEVYASTRGTTLTYTGLTALFQNTNLSNAITSVFVRNITIAGAPILYNIVATQNIEVNNIVYLFCADYGTVNATNILFNRHGIVGMSKGLVIINPKLIDIDSINLIFTGTTGKTLYSIITGANLPSMNIVGIISDIADADESLIFVDNVPVDGFLVIEKCQPGLGEIYQLGADVTVDSVADNGSGKARFTTSTPHGLIIGRPVILSGFPSYDGTVVVTAVDTPLTGTTFDVEELSFGVNQSGNMTAKSLDQTDVRVTSRNNFDQPDSMSLSECRNGNPIDVVTTNGTFVPFENAAPVVGDYIQDDATERFIVNDSTGIITYIGERPITVTLAYHYNIQKTAGSGSTSTATVSLFQADIQQVKTDQILAITTSVQKITGAGGLFKVQPNDTFQLKINNDAAHTDQITEYIMLITRQ